MKKIISVMIIVITMVFLFPAVVVADPAADLAEALVYWQEQALLLRQENEVLRVENTRLTSENKALRLTLGDAEALIWSLRADLNAMAINVEKMNSLRLQAENALSLAIIEIEKLELTIKKLSGARFGLIFGAVYNGSFGGLAGVTVSF